MAEPETFRLEIVTPEARLVSEEARELVAPGCEGYFGVLPGHIPFVTTLDIGELTYRVNGSERHLAVGGGYVEVRRDHVIVLADRAERAEEIDVDRAQRARARAEERLRHWSEGNETIDAARAQAALMRALVRLSVAQHGH